MTAHKHAANMMKYAQDAADTDKPWERWEFLERPAGVWHPLDCTPTWSIFMEYRRKPNIIRINGFEVPEPCREPLEEGTEYFTPSLFADCAWYIWRGDKEDERFLRGGIIHLTREAAEIHAKALMSFTTKKE